MFTRNLILLTATRVSLEADPPPAEFEDNYNLSSADLLTAACERLKQRHLPKACLAS